MKKLLPLLAVLSTLSTMSTVSTAADLDGMALPDNEQFNPWYLGASPGVMVFQRGVSANPARYAALRLGYEYTPTTALEFGGLLAPSVRNSSHGRNDWNGTSRLYGLHADALFHWDSGVLIRWCDPYLLAGAGVYGGGKPYFNHGRAAFAPRLGIGVMSHLTERVSLRADAVALCFANRHADFAASFELALVWHFGE